MLTSSIVCIDLSSYLSEVVENSCTNQLFLTWISTAFFAWCLPAQRLIVLLKLVADRSIDWGELVCELLGRYDHLCTSLSGWCFVPQGTMLHWNWRIVNHFEIDARLVIFPRLSLRTYKSTREFRTVLFVAAFPCFDCAHCAKCLSSLGRASPYLGSTTFVLLILDTSCVSNVDVWFLMHRLA